MTATESTARVPVSGSREPTEEQASIIEGVRASADSLMVKAFAGCAKSTTLEMAAPGVRQAALALAFNRKIASDLQPRLPGQFTVKTLNGCGFRAWTLANPGVGKWQVDDRKLGKLVTQVARERKVELKGDQWDACRRLVSHAMLQGIVPGDQGEPLTADTVEAWADIAFDTLWMSEDEFGLIYDIARQVLEESIAMARAGVISFDDQVYASVCLGGRFMQYPVVVIDEAQDLSPLNHAMLGRSLRPDGRLIAVGDPKQAIYQFRGASARSMELMRGLRKGWKDFPLATTFRCPKEVVRRNAAHAPGFRAWHTNAEGRFHQFRSPGPEDGTLVEGWTWGDVEGMRIQPDASLAVLCRNNGPLLALAFKLIRQRVGVVMLGRDIGKGLQALSRKLAPEDRTPSDAVRGAVTEWESGEISLALANGHEEKVAGVTDRAECLRAVLDGTECQDAGQLRDMLEQLFARDTGRVTLGSIHRAKGLEWDVVLHLDPWRIPSRHARDLAKRGSPETLEQEWNLKYVCETRTRHTLAQADLEGFQP